MIALHEPERNRDYRSNELHPEVAALFDYVRDEKRREVPRQAVDVAIRLQKTRSIFTACNYVRYLLLHELNYVDVFGKQAIEYDRQLEHYQQCKDLELKVDALTETVSELKEQNEQMQTMLMNMAKMLSNNSHSAVRRTA
jgi:hypothetical protein